MWARLSIVAGLVLGIAVGGAGARWSRRVDPRPDGAVDACPDEQPDGDPVSRLVGRARLASVAPQPLVAPTASLAPSASPAPTASPGPSASPPGGSANAPDTAGIVRDGAAWPASGRVRWRPDRTMTSSCPASTSRLDPARSTDAELDPSVERDRRLAALARRPGRLLVVADFDGTLAEGSRDPGAAAIVPLARRALRRLARVADGTAGARRDRDPDRPDGRRRRRARPRRWHHLPRRPRPPVRDLPASRGVRHGSRPRSVRGHEGSLEPAEILASRVPAVLGRPAWLFVERKGPSVAFHVRQADDRAAARAAVEAAIEQVDRELPPHELGHYRGRLVVDLRPRSAGGKREAFEELLARERPATVVAFGDDLSDADGFAVLRAARTAGTSGGLAVAVTGPHGMPDEVRAAADVVLDTPFDAARALSALAAALERETAAGR